MILTKGTKPKNKDPKLCGTQVTHLRILQQRSNTVLAKPRIQGQVQRRYRVRRRHHHPQPPSESKDLEFFLDFALEAVNIMVPVPLQAPALLALILHVSLRHHSSPNGAEWTSERRSNVNCFISSNFHFVCNIPVAETSIRHRCSLGHSTMP